MARNINHMGQSVVIIPSRVKLSSLSLSHFYSPPSPHFSASLCKHIQYTDTSTWADTGTSVPRLHCPTQASFIPWSGKQLEHCRCSTWVGSEGPFGKDFFFVVFTLLIHKHFQVLERVKCCETALLSKLCWARECKIQLQIRKEEGENRNVRNSV